MFPILLTLCLMLSVTYYAQNYADIIGWSLPHASGVFIRQTTLDTSCVTTVHAISPIYVSTYDVCICAYVGR